MTHDRTTEFNSSGTGDDVELIYPSLNPMTIQGVNRASTTASHTIKKKKNTVRIYYSFRSSLNQQHTGQPLTAN